jgi:hypothetical protein
LYLDFYAALGYDIFMKLKTFPHTHLWMWNRLSFSNSHQVLGSWIFPLAGFLCFICFEL